MRTLKLATRWDHEYSKWSHRTIAMATIHKIQAKALNGLKSWYGSRICWWLHSTSPWLRSCNDACQQAVCVFSSTKEISGLHTEMEGFVLFGPSVLRRIGYFLLPFLLQVGIRWPPPFFSRKLVCRFCSKSCFRTQPNTPHDCLVLIETLVSWITSSNPCQAWHSSSHTGPNVRWGFAFMWSRWLWEIKNCLLLVVGSFNHVNYG